MKTKSFKRCLSLLLVFLLCAALMTPAVTAAATDDEAGIAATAADGDVLEKHAVGTTIAKSDLQGLFGDSTSITNTAFYGYAPVPAADTDLDTATIVYVSGSGSIAAGEYLALKTTAYTGSLLNRKPNWTDLSKRSQLSFSVKTYYAAEFTVTGSSDGALYLNGEAVDSSARLYTDETYTVTAANVEGFTCEVSGVTLGEAFTPSSDLTITAAYTADASAAIALSYNEGGTAKILCDGEEVTTDTIPAGKTFSVEATPNTVRGYKLDSIAVTKDGEAVDAADGVFGPVADGESYVVTVTFKYDPPRVSKDVDATKGQVSRSDLNSLFNGAYNYYGIAPVSDPDSVTYLAVALTSNYDVEDGGEYLIYGSNDGNILSPRWTNAKLMVMTVRTYYTGTFAVSGHDDGEVYLNGDAVDGSVKLYADTEYTVTAKAIDEYFYTIEGAEDGAAFTPSANVNVSVTYLKEAYATFSVRQSDGGIVAVMVNGEEVTDRISEGDTFTVTATPNANRGYKLENVTVQKNDEVIEANEGTDYEYGPVADGETYYITAAFTYDPPRVSKDVDANKGQVSRSDLSSLFNGAYNYYGIAPVSDPEAITYLAIALTADYDVEDGGEYIIYGSNDGNILSPKWTNAKLMVMTVRTYYTGTFAVTGHDDGEVYLNGEAVDGNVKLYADSEYTVTAKAIEQYICTVYGAEEGTAFTPTEDVEVTAAYIKEKYATVTLTANDGGTASLQSDGEPVFDKIPEGASFEVVANANANDDYYIESIVVTKDGEETEAVDGFYGPVLDGESYEVTVTFARATLAAQDCEVNLIDIKNKNFDAVSDSILANIVLSPAAFADGAVVKAEYAAYTVLGQNIYEPLNFTGALSHAFGTSSYGGELLAGNTEAIRITCELPAYGITLRAYATVTVTDHRIPTRVEGSNITITYGDDLKAAVMDVIAVYTDENEAIDFTEDDITVSPSSLNVKLLSRQEVTVTYGGSDTYAVGTGTVSVYVKQAPSTLDTKSETITYGETPAAQVITTPEDLDYLLVIAGIDGEAQGFVSIDIPESLKDKMQIKVGDTVLFDIYEYIRQNIGDGSTIEDLRAIVTGIFDRVNQNEAIRNAMENSGINMDVIETVMNFIDDLPAMNSDLKIRLGQVPSNAGAYLVCAVSTDMNYTLSADVSYLVILPQTDSEETSVALRYKAEMGEEANILSFEEAQEFVFGGDLYINEEVFETSHLHTLYAGVTSSGEVITQEEPVRTPGFYTETVYVLGGNYMPTPLIRTYTVSRMSVELLMDDLTVDYDGRPHTTKAYTEDDVDLTGKVVYTYSGNGYFGNTAPSWAGEFTVYAYYPGDDMHMPTSATATLTINPPVSPVKRYILGDVDGDGEVTSIDATLIQRFLARSPVPDTLNLVAADVDGDGDVTAVDVTFIQRHLAAMPDLYDIGEYVEV